MYALSILLPFCREFVGSDVLIQSMYTTTHSFQTRLLEQSSTLNSGYPFLRILVVLLWNFKLQIFRIEA